MILDFTESKFTRWQKNFFAQPHQPFFVLGFAQAFYTIFVLALALFSVINIDLKTFHIINITFFMPASFFLGFLLTVMCRFLNQPYYVKKDYMFIFWFLIASFFITNLGFFTSIYISMFGITISLVALFKACLMFAKAYYKSTTDDKFDEFWILAIFSTSIICVVLFTYSFINPMFFALATNFSFYIFATGTV
ncbi:MAG: hypothetical protein RL154_1108, partial [Pseudomonadota bacterium]